MITCAVTSKLRETMLLKPSDLKKLRDGEGVFGTSSSYSEGYTFEHSWFDMAQIPDEERRIKEEEGEVRVREVDVPPDEGDVEQGSDQESVEAEEEGDLSSEREGISVSPVLEHPVSKDTAMCLLDPHVKELVEAQRNDVSLKHCFEDAVKSESCFIVDESAQVLFRRWERLKFKYNQLVVPTEYRKRIMELAHDEGGHAAGRKTNLMVQMNFWWPRVRRDIANYVSSCAFCQSKRRGRYMTARLLWLFLGRRRVLK